MTVSATATSAISATTNPREGRRITVTSQAFAAPPWRASSLDFGPGSRIAVFETGRTDAAAPVIVLVHGMGHWTQSAWNALAAELASTHRIVAFDLPGFGASDKPDAPYGVAYFVRAIDAVARHAGLDRFALCGHSLGALAAAAFAADRPQRVRVLALLDPAGFLRTPVLVLRVAGSRLLQRLLARIRPSPRFVRATLAGAVFDPACIPEADFARAEVLAADPGMRRAFARVYASAMGDLLHFDALHARLARYRGPVVVLWGERDRYVPVRGTATARRTYPQARVETIERCGHCPAIEFPELVARRLIAAGA